MAVGLFKDRMISLPGAAKMANETVAVMLTQLFLWIPVLFGGHYPKWGYGFVGGYVRWTTRVTAYHFGLTDAYPPFTLRN